MKVVTAYIALEHMLLLHRQLLHTPSLHILLPFFLPNEVGSAKALVEHMSTYRVVNPNRSLGTNLNFPCL